MKTLDEVLKALTYCNDGLCEDCPERDDYGERCTDALICHAYHYLREYKAIQMDKQKGTEMKTRTLDEVIKALEFCIQDNDNCPAECPFIESCSPTSYAMKKDALHYLQEYQLKERREELNDFSGAIKKIQISLAELKKSYEAYEDRKRLTWDELLEMKGKPVFVKYGNLHHSRWIIIKDFDKDGEKERFVAHDGGLFYKDSEGWKAYRSERE